MCMCVCVSECVCVCVCVSAAHRVEQRREALAPMATSHGITTPIMVGYAV